MLSLHDPLPISTRTPVRAGLSRGGRAPRSGAGAGQFARRAGTRDPGEFPVQVRALRGMAPGGIFRDGKEFRDLRGWGGSVRRHAQRCGERAEDGRARKSVESGKNVYGRVDMGGSRIMKKKIRVKLNRMA